MSESNASSINYQHLLGRYARYAPRYDRRFARYSTATLGKALELIPLEGPSKLLDVACGTGLLIDMIRRERPDVQTTGVDISPQMLERARERIAPQPGKVEWLISPAETLALHSNTFDIVTCTNAFHLVQDAPKALREFRRVLKTDGTLVLVDWCRDFPFMKFRDAVLAVIDHQRRKIRLLRELVELVESSGFAIQTRRRFKTGLWGMMCMVAQNPAIPSPQRDLQPAHIRAKTQFSRS
jgi:ubiquinone/menaquinone biosynthesis C-methylase UbiE